MAYQREHRLVPVLFVGQADPELERKLWEHGIGVITTDSVDRALHLLTNFTVAAVIYDRPAVERLHDLTATRTRVIAFVHDGPEWTDRDVTTLRRSAPIASIAAAVRQGTALRARQFSEGDNTPEFAPPLEGRERDVLPQANVEFGG